MAAAAAVWRRHHHRTTWGAGSPSTARRSFRTGKRTGAAAVAGARREEEAPATRAEEGATAGSGEGDGLAATRSGGVRAWNTTDNGREPLGPSPNSEVRTHRKGGVVEYRVKVKEISRLVLVLVLLRSLRRRRDEGRAGRRSPSGEQSSGGEGILT
uniref:Uncharacterized protein n=1 Tax=Oryza rufipogon TaxID=4529 RepID=A0A0E0PVY8_ORYRU